MNALGDRDSDSTDQTVLAFVAAHELVLSSQVRRVAGEQTPACDRRMERLAGAGLVQRRPRLRSQRAAYCITPRGLDSLGSGLPQPRLDLRSYWSDLALGWLWAGAYTGVFGEVDAIYSRRQMRAADAASASQADSQLLSPALAAKLADTRFAIELAGGEARYPGVVLVVPQGRIALEWIMTPPSESAVERLIVAYAAKPQIRVAVLIAMSTGVRDRVKALIERRGLGDRVQAQQGKFMFDSR